MNSNTINYLTFNKGRLGNQLFYALQAYRLSKHFNITVKYAINKEAVQSKIYDFLIKLNLDKYVEESNTAKYINSYCQNLNTDFYENELNSFIVDNILKSEIFSKYSFDDKYINSVAIHIRNGDYLNLKIHNCFDRVDYINKACLNFLQNNNISTLYVFSDNNLLNKQLYDDIFHKYFKNIVYITNTTFTDDFCELCKFKNKIIWSKC